MQMLIASPAPGNSTFDKLLCTIFTKLKAVKAGRASLRVQTGRILVWVVLSLRNEGKLNLFQVSCSVFPFSLPGEVCCKCSYTVLELGAPREDLSAAGDVNKELNSFTPLTVCPARETCWLETAKPENATGLTPPNNLLQSFVSWLVLCRTLEISSQLKDSGVTWEAQPHRLAFAGSLGLA